MDCRIDSRQHASRRMGPRRSSILWFATFSSIEAPTAAVWQQCIAALHTTTGLVRWCVALHRTAATQERRAPCRAGGRTCGNGKNHENMKTRNNEGRITLYGYCAQAKFALSSGVKSCSTATWRLRSCAAPAATELLCCADFNRRGSRLAAPCP